jgi:3-carboxy-cis,cis-muconate cycloisomerase
MAERGLFGGVFARGGADTGDRAWLTAMLQTEAALARAVERAGLARAVERAGLAPPGAGAAVTEAAWAGAIDAAELGRQAALTGNPVPALVRALARCVPAYAAAAVHRGATSQDIIDTAAMLLARRALAAAAADMAAAADATAALTARHRDTVMIGRSLLQQAVPVTFGLVTAGWLTGLDEARAGLDRVRAGRLAVQFGGAAGTLASLGADGSRVAALLADELGLPLPVLPWHTDRLRILEVAASCAGAAAVLGKIARDVTLLAQSEVAEVREGESGVREGGPRWRRCARETDRAREPAAAGRRRCRTSGTRSPRSPSSAARARCRDCSPP